MSLNEAYVEVSPSNAYKFTNASTNDVVLYASAESQQILMGTKCNVNAGISLTQSNITFTVQGNSNTGNAITFNTANSNQVMTILGGGNIGINNSNPAYTLDVIGTVNANAVLVNGSNLTASGGGSAGFWSSNSSNMFTYSNVGVGTSNPQKILHVSGDVQFDSNIYLANQISAQGLKFTKNLTGAAASISTIVSSVPGYTWNSNVTIAAYASNNNIVFKNGSAEVMRCQSNFLGIGTSNPTAMLTMGGASNSMAGPHVQVYTNADSNPVFQQLNLGHNNVAMSFDMYYNGSNWISTSTSNNYTIYKNAGQLRVNWASNAAVGSNIATNPGICLNSNGFVGIGTLNPTYNMDVNGTGKFYVNSNLGVSISNVNPVVSFGSSNGGNKCFLNVSEYRVAAGSNWATSSTRVQKVVDTNNMGYIGFGESNDACVSFGTSNTEVMRVTGTGNVGIGMSSTSYKLDVSGTGRFYVTSNLGVSISNINPVVSFGSSNGGNKCFLNVSEYRIAAGSNWATSSTRVQKVVDTTNMGYIGFGEGGDACVSFGSSNTEVMRVTGTGNVGIGVSSTSYKFDVNGTGHIGNGLTMDSNTLTFANTSFATPAVGVSGGTGDRVVLMKGGASAYPNSIGVDNASNMWSSTVAGASNMWYQGGVAVMSVTATELLVKGDVAGYASICDQRLKDNVTDLGNNLQRVCDLRPVEFTWNDKCTMESQIGKRDIGFIAQEVESVVPEATVDRTMFGTSIKTIRYERLIPILVGAIQDLKAELDELKLKVQSSSL
jgi:hypothetical protein